MDDIFFVRFTKKLGFGSLGILWCMIFILKYDLFKYFLSEMYTLKQH